MELNLQRQPEDHDMRTLIDGFAKFVAKNGVEFENLTKEKHKGNPQFSFIFGGPFYQYYQQKLSDARHSQQADHESSLDQIPLQHPQDPLVDEFEQIIKPVIIQCSKDSISAGKSWILSHFQTQDECIRVSQLLLGKTKLVPGMSFFDRLHIVYLINDVLHHCIRKNNQHLRRALQQQIPHIFSNCSKGTTPDNLKKLAKLVKIWRSQDYFEEGILVSLDFIISQRELELANMFAPDNEPPQQHSLPLNPFPPPQPTDPSHIHLQHPPMHQHPPQSSHNFPPSTGHLAPPYPPGGEGPDRHPMPQQGFVNSHPNQFNYFPQQPRFRPPPPMHPGFEMPRHPSHHMDGMHSWPQSHPFPFNPHDQYNHGHPLRAPGPPERFEHPSRFDRPHPGDGRFSDIKLEPNDYPYIHQEVEHMCPDPRNPHHFSHSLHEPALPERFNRPFQPDTPPPDFNQELEPAPTCSSDSFQIQYYDLPAGLMAPLVPLEEHNYTPLDPSLIRLPSPQQPSQRLLNAVENFYSPPTEENPRNKKGWEAKALIDFFEAKRMAILGRSPLERPRAGVLSEPGRFERLAPSFEKDKNYQESSHSSGHSPSGSRTPSSLSHESSHSSYSGSAPGSPLREGDLVDTTSEAYPTRDRKSDRMGEELGFSSYSFHQSTNSDDTELIDDKYAGVGLDLKPSDIYEQYRRTKSYTYNRRPPPSKKSGYKGRK